MELSEIRINNFRSIKNEKITFPHNCIILLGKNEAGKTNILKAAAAVFDEYKVSNKDKRKRLDNEKIEEYYIRAIISLNETDFKKVLEKFKNKFKSSEVIKFKSGKTLLDFISKYYNLLITIDIADNKKAYYSYWTFNKSDFILENELYVTSNNSLISTSTEGVQKFNLENEIFSIIKSLYNENPIKCHYWQYSENYLLPNSVSIDEFISTPEEHKALENIFLLCGRANVKKEFDDALSEDGDYSNLLEQISKKVTNTFQKIWKDFKGTSIQLLPNGDEILIKVVDKAKYNFEDRSDGFKKFISILLMLSTQSRSNNIYENDIILIDEPDQSLYPTSAQHLRDELIEISKIAKVIYSTHSQYMIDSNHLDRHFVVEKKDDITSIIKEHINSPYITDELLRRAIGSSIFECLRPINIIFEGYLDKRLFELYINYNNLDKDFSSYGKVYLSGISGADSLVQILLLAQKKFIIIADSDEASRNKRADFEKTYFEFKNNWIAYGDIDNKLSTMEDFFTVKFLQDQILKAGHTYSYDESKNAIYNIDKATNKDKILKQDIKNALVKVVKKTHITDNYRKFIDIIKEKLEQL